MRAVEYCLLRMSVQYANSLMMNTSRRKFIIVTSVAYAGKIFQVNIVFRVGGQENTFHCDGCGCCMNKALIDNHECKGERLNNDCAVCMESLFTSRDPSIFLRCGHSMH